MILKCTSLALMPNVNTVMTILKINANVSCHIALIALVFNGALTTSEFTSVTLRT
jgi:hypothetical protein